MPARSLVALLAFALFACSGRYMGIDTFALAPPVAALVQRASAGDKQAQFELGLRFARGFGMPQDCGKARKLLREAAAPSGGTIWVYSPPVTKGGAGRVIPVDRGPMQPGLVAAQDALAYEGLCRASEDAEFS